MELGGRVVFADAKWFSCSNMSVMPSRVPYPLNVYHALCQLHLSKAGDTC